MSIRGATEDLLRRSFVFKYAGLLRQSNPRLYAAARVVLEKVLRRTSQSDLAQYQVRSIERACRLAGLDLSTTDVLEVGSDIDKRVVREFARRGARRVFGINPALDDLGSSSTDEGLPSNIKVGKGDVRALEFEDESLTFVFSVAVFEHLTDFPRCLSEMYRVLKPGGFLYAHFGPIWSSSLGHHVCAYANGEEARHWDPRKNPVPNFAHLLLGRQELERVLRGKVSDALLREILVWIYDSTDINRLFYEDYVRMLRESDFSIEHFSDDEEYVDAKIIKELCSRYPGFNKFSVRNMEVLLKK